MSSDEPALTVSGLTIDYVGEPAQANLIQDVSFEVGHGESVALVGESGCGKSLTALAILRLLSPQMKVTRGSTFLGGQDLLKTSQRELRALRGDRIGAVFQDPMTSLDPSMTVGAQVSESRRRHLNESRRRARAKSVELLDLVGIPGAARRMRCYPHELSGGMQQRVMIAAAIACEPSLLLADEPTTALDATVQADILQLLRELQSSLGTAVLLVTHDLGVVADFCQRMVVMYAGHVVERGDVADLFGKPRHPYTAALLGSVPQSGQARTMLDVIPGRVPPNGSLPDGCRFRPRCGHALPRCAEPQHGSDPVDPHFTLCDRVAEGELNLERDL